jgi:UDP-2,3-diacylglucosamine pyrophosphatase LpxH
MRSFFQNLLTKPVVKLADKLSSWPDKKRVDKALSELYQNITTNPGKKGMVINFDAATDRFIIFSDQHKGARDGMDIFALAEKNYLSALNYYDKQGFFYINLGDSEELWENLFLTIKRHNKATFEQEKKFLQRSAFIKIFGNHDLYWANDPLAPVGLIQLYDQAVKIHEGVVLKTLINDKPLNIYMTHGHQGDLQSDGNWFSKWFISDIWGPLQAYLRINPNTPANNDQLKTAHNGIMYEWSSKQENLLLITGHTHQPVFRSLTHLETLYQQQEAAKSQGDTQLVNELQQRIIKLHNQGAKIPDYTKYKPSYFNSGCCCFDDGDISGIELEGGYIRLIKWEYNNQKESGRVVLEECSLESLLT